MYYSIYLVISMNSALVVTHSYLIKLFIIITFLSGRIL